MTAPIFEQLRSDHSRALRVLSALEHVAEFISASAESGEQRTATAEAELERLIASFEFEFATHMVAEDTVIFPALAKALPESLGHLQRFHGEHAELRGILRALRELIEQPRSAPRNEQIGVQTRDFVELVRIHIRKEEAAVFRVAEGLLTSMELEGIARRWTSLTDSHPHSTKREIS